jgi:hypothetical protein
VCAFRVDIRMNCCNATDVSALTRTLAGNS